MIYRVTLWPRYECSDWQEAVVSISDKVKGETKKTTNAPTSRHKMKRNSLIEVKYTCTSIFCNSLKKH